MIEAYLTILKCIGYGTFLYGIERMTRDLRREFFIKKQIKEIWDTIGLINHFAKYDDKKDKIYNYFKIKKIIKKEYGYDLYIILPPGVTIDYLTDKKDIIEASYRTKVAIDYTFETGDIYIRLFYDFNQKEFTPVKVEPYELYVGNKYDKPIIIDMNKRPHLFITGTTGTGKNVLLQMIVSNLMHFHDSSKVQFYFTQLMKQELIEFKLYENTKGMAFKLDDAAKMFKELDDIMEKRTKEIFKYVEQGVKNIKQYNDRFKNRQMPYIYVVIDEYAFYMPEKSDDKETKLKKAYCSSIIKKILFDGRALGVFCIPIAQRPDSDTITGSFKAQVTNTITFQQTNETSSKVAIDDGIAASLKERQAILKTNELIFIDIPYVDDNLIKGYLKHRRKKEEKRQPIELKVIELPKKDNNIKDNKKEKKEDGIIRKGVGK